MYLDNLRIRYLSYDLEETRHCVESEILELEQKLGFRFPKAYREFLLWMGGNCGDLSELVHPHGYYSSTYIVSELPELVEKASEILKETKASLELPENILVFQAYRHINDPQHFRFLDTQSDDPAVYIFREGDTQYTKTNDAFSEFLSDGLESHITHLEYLKRTYGIGKPFAETHYLDQVKALYQQQGRRQPHPCTQGEVVRLENQLGFSLPDAFREFLLWGGHWAELGMEGSDFFYSEIYSLTRRIALELLRFHSEPELLPEDAVVFWMHQGYMFEFIRASGGNHAPTWGYFDGDDEVKEKDTIADFLLEFLGQPNTKSADNINFKQIDSN
jgi:hypothetical protein